MWVGLLLVVSLLAIPMTSKVEADLKPLKFSSLTVNAPEGMPKANVDYLQAAIAGELLKRGAVMDKNGIKMNVTATPYASGVKLVGQIADARAASVSIAVSDPNAFLYKSDQLARMMARRFADQMAEQIDAQQTKGKTAPGMVGPAATQGVTSVFSVQ